MSSSDVIDTLYNDTKVTLEGMNKEVEVKRVKLKDLSKILGIANTILAELGLQDGKLTVNLADSSVMFRLLSRLPEEAALLMAMLSSLSKEEIDDLDMADGLQLLTKVIEVNKGFFFQKVKPKLDEVMRASGLMTAAG